MQPTAKLRFVERFEQDPAHPKGIGRNVKILQQWFDEVIYIPDFVLPTGKGEWRDIPLETE